MSWLDLKREWRFNRQRYKKEDEWAKKAYDANVIDGEATEANVLAVARAVMAGVPPGADPPLRLDELIRRVKAGLMLPPEAVEAPPPPKAPPPKPAVGRQVTAARPREGREAPDFADRVFEEVWAWWSVDLANPARREHEATARDAWRKAVRLGKAPEDLVQAAEHYRRCFLDKAYRMKYPMLCKRFFSDANDFEVLEDWLHRARHAVPEADQAAFDAAYAAYPHGAGHPDRDGDCAFWRRHVAPADRLDFYFAVREYARDRRHSVTEAAFPAEEARYTMGFAKFVAGWRAVRYAGLASFTLGPHLYRALVELGHDALTPDGLGGPLWRAAVGGVHVGMTQSCKAREGLKEPCACAGYHLSVPEAARYTVRRLVPEADPEPVLRKMLDRAGLACYTEGVCTASS